MKTLTKFAAAAALGSIAMPASASTYIVSGGGFDIEDNSTASSEIIVSTNAVIDYLTVDLTIDHTWIGDLVISLSNGSTSVVLLDRPGVPESTFGVSDNISGTYTFDDNAAAATAESSAGGTITPGSFQPQGGLIAFAGANTAGTWTLTISDLAGGDVGVLSSWSLDFAKSVGGAVPEPGTWLLMILGFGMVGGAMRRRNAVSTRISYS
jgi:subtilisin-like proprotein convertase family protein